MTEQLYLILSRWNFIREYPSVSLLHLCVLAIKNSLRRTTKKASQNSRAILHKQSGTTRPLCSRYKELFSFFGAEQPKGVATLWCKATYTSGVELCVCVCVELCLVQAAGLNTARSYDCSPACCCLEDTVSPCLRSLPPLYQAAISLDFLPAFSAHSFGPAASFEQASLWVASRYVFFNAHA